MPELPEVEVVRAGLERALVGRTITGVEVVGPLGARILRRFEPGPAAFGAALTGAAITAVRRRGKYLWWALAGGDAVLAHLGMSGQFRIGPAGGDRPAGHRHLRVRFTLATAPHTVDFVDQRTFGSLMFVSGGAALPAPIAHIGRDPLDTAFDRTATVRRIRASGSAIKRVLLDQRIVSGIGNIYADEALWAARLHYDRPADTISTRTVGRLLDEATAVMCAALAVGGTSFDELYVDVDGDAGYFERSLSVYGREGAPCPRCETPVRRAAFMNRSSFFCPRCQRRA